MIPIILIFSHVLSAQILFYPLLLIGGLIMSPFEKFKIKMPLSGINLYFFLFYVFFLVTIICFDLYRGASWSLIIWNVRFFYGIGFVVLCFRLVNNLHIGRTFFWVLTALTLYEAVSLNLLNAYPFYWAYSGYEANFLVARANNAGFFQILGPALNSSISGTLHVVILFIMLQNLNNTHGLKLTSDKALIFLSLICIFLASSTVAYAVFMIGALLNIKDFIKKNLKYLIMFIFLFVFLQLIFPEKTEIDFGPAIKVIFHKYYSLTESYKITESIFGWQSLANLNSIGVGGDFMFLAQFLLNGFFPVALFICVLYFLTPSSSKIFLILGIISTLHYGALYTLLGQLFFGAIIANKLKL